MNRAVSQFLFSKLRSAVGFAFTILTLHLIPSEVAWAQAINWPNEFDRCYALDWHYESDNALRIEPTLETSTLLWYCQAKPKTAPSFIYRQYQSYQVEWLDAIDFSMMRCERGESDDCTYRCALAPRVCAPHFWP